MPNHIILTAFGTTTRAHEAYQHFEDRISPQFPGHEIHWAYSSPTVRRCSRTGTTKLQSVKETIASIAAGDAIAVQSLHILPGWEFGRITDEVNETGVRTAIGLPLLNDGRDLVLFMRCLQPLIVNSGTDAVLLLGHGTNHPCRSTFTELEHRLHEQFGARVFVSTLEYPDESPQSTVARIAAAGHRTAMVIPLLLVAGMHFRRDITGDREDSWKNLLAGQSVGMDIHDRGLAMLPGVAEIFCDHIHAAFASLSP